MKRAGQTLYAKSSGVEISSTTREKEKGDYVSSYGAIRVRFFEMEKGKKSITLILNPVEACKASRAIKLCLKSKQAVKEQICFHKFKGEKGEQTTSVEAQKWVKGDKSGYALVVFQKNGTNVVINVPLDRNTAIYASLLFENLSMDASWTDYRKVGGEGTEETGTGTGTENPEGEDDIDDDDIDF